MATVTFNPNASLPAFDMVQARLDFPALMQSYTDGELTETRMSFSTNAANRTVIEGTDFDFINIGGDLILMDGTINRMVIRIGSASPTITFENLNVDAVEFGALLNAGSVRVYDLLLSGDDTISGAGGRDVLKGFNGNDRLSGLGGNDTLYGDAGGDTMFGGDQNDTMFGGTGNDTIGGGSGIDVLFGEAGADELSGGDGNDSLFGAAGKDTMAGGNGIDTLDGDLGNDNLTGGTGADIFVFNDALGASNRDTITDFNVVADTMQLDNLIFRAIADGVLAVGAFRSNLSGLAQDGSDRIIYEEDTGKVYYDRDGVGTNFARVHFVTLDDGLSLTNADFAII